MFDRPHYNQIIISAYTSEINQISKYRQKYQLNTEINIHQMWENHISGGKNK